MAIIRDFDRLYLDDECGGFGRNGLEAFSRMAPYLSNIIMFSHQVSNACEITLQNLEDIATYFNNLIYINIEINLPSLEPSRKWDEVTGSYISNLPDNWSTLSRLRYLELWRFPIQTLTTNQTNGWKDLQFFECRYCQSWEGPGLLFLPSLGDNKDVQVRALGSTICQPTSIEDCQAISGDYNASWSETMIAKSPHHDFRQVEVNITEAAKDPNRPVICSAGDRQMICEWPGELCGPMKQSYFDEHGFGEISTFRALREQYAGSHKPCSTSQSEWTCNDLYKQYKQDSDLNNNGRCEADELFPDFLYSSYSRWTPPGEAERRISAQDKQNALDCVLKKYLNSTSYAMLDWFDMRMKGQHSCNQCSGSANTKWFDWEKTLEKQEKNRGDNVLLQAHPVQCAGMMDTWTVELIQDIQDACEATETACLSTCASVTYLPFWETLGAAYIPVGDMITPLVSTRRGDLYDEKMWECLAKVTSCTFQDVGGELYASVHSVIKIAYGMWPGFFPEGSRTDCSDCAYIGHFANHEHPHCPHVGCSFWPVDTCQEGEDPGDLKYSTTCQDYCADLFQTFGTMDADTDRFLSEDEFHDGLRGVFFQPIAHRRNSCPFGSCLAEFAPQCMANIPDSGNQPGLPVEIALKWAAHGRRHLPFKNLYTEFKHPEDLSDCSSCPEMHWLKSYPTCESLCLYFRFPVSCRNTETACSDTCWRGEGLEWSTSIDVDYNNVITNSEWDEYWDEFPVCSYECIQSIEPACFDAVADGEPAISLATLTRILVGVSGDYHVNPDHYPITSCESCGYFPVGDGTPLEIFDP
jgi:hypothetical protein